MMTRQEIERMAKLEDRNAELARENAELRKKQSSFTNGDTSNLSGVETFFMNLVKDGKLSQLPPNYDCATLKMYISHLENENAKLKARLEKAVKAQCEWTSVEERLPETDNKNTRDFNVLVYIPPRSGCVQNGIYLGKLSHVNADDGTGNFWRIKTEACDWTVWGWSYFEHPVVTHWKPLPALPIEAEQRLAELKGARKGEE